MEINEYDNITGTWKGSVTVCNNGTGISPIIMSCGHVYYLNMYLNPKCTLGNN